MRPKSNDTALSYPYANPLPMIGSPCFPRWSVRPQSNETARSYGARLLAWRPSDLQSTILRHSHSAVLAQRQRTGDAFAAEPALWCHEVLRAAATFHLVRVRVPNPNPNPNQVLRAAAAFHLVDLTGSFDSAMARMRQLTGLELPPFRKVPPPKYDRPLPPPLSVRGLHDAHRVNLS